MAVRYRQSVVTFLDILGFKDIISNSSADEVSTMLDAVAETAAVPVDDTDHTEIISFSDSVIRVRQIGPESAFEALLYEVRSLSAAQWTLMDLGIFLRGGCTIGKVATGQARAFGPAFVRAYELESSLASVPRIVIDPVVIKELRAHITTVKAPVAKKGMIDELKSCLRLGADGLWFVDYLACTSKMLARDDVEEFIPKFRDTIVSKASNLPERSMVISKYLWLIRYFNQFIKTSYSDKKLKITRKDVPLSDEFLRPLVMPVSKK